MTTHTNRASTSTTHAAASRYSAGLRPSASLLRPLIHAILAGAAIAVVVHTGWPVPPESTLVLGIGFVLWLMGSFATERPPWHDARGR